MSATTVIRQLLVGRATVLASVPADCIRIGVLPQGTPLPAIGITTVSGVWRNTLSMAEPRRLMRERVQVTVHAKTYPELDRVIRLVAQALPNTRDTIANVDVLSIVASTIGPDLERIDPVISTRSLDYHVSYLW